LLPGIAFASDPNTGIYNPSADNLAISTGGTGRIFVDANGNVGINISAPDVFLHSRITGGGGVPATSGTSQPNAAIRIGGSGTTGVLDLGCNSGAPWIQATDRTDLSQKYQLLLNPNGGNVGIGSTSLSQKLTVDGSVAVNGGHLIPYNGATPTGYIGYGGALGNGNDIAIRCDTGSILFGFSGAERARIDSSGRLLVGLTSGSYQLQLSTDSAGKPSTNTWTIVSDERIKEDIELADLDLCYEAIKTIPLKRYKWRDDVYSEDQVTDRRKLGWIAQDVESVFPKAVSIHKFKYNQVYETVTVPEVLEELDDEGNVIKEAVPEHTQQELISEETIPDCKDLNADQIYAAMYGAIQKLIIKFEAFEERLDAAGIK
jgi:hypothetical protein